MFLFLPGISSPAAGQQTCQGVPWGWTCPPQGKEVSQGAWVRLGAAEGCPRGGWLMGKGQGWGTACSPPASPPSLNASQTLEELVGFMLEVMAMRRLRKGSEWRVVKRQPRWESLESEARLAYLWQRVYSAFLEKRLQGWPQKTLRETVCVTSHVGRGVKRRRDLAPAVPARPLERLCWELLNGTGLPLLTAPAALLHLKLVQPGVWGKVSHWCNFNIHHIKLCKWPEARGQT